MAAKIFGRCNSNMSLQMRVKMAPSLPASEGRSKVSALYVVLSGSTQEIPQIWTSEIPPL